MHKDRIWLERIIVEGLHGELDIYARFNSGINVIYGENGVGKTTLLHIISNVANFDFERFKFINFHTISLMMSNGTYIMLLKRPDSDFPVVTIDGKLLSISIDNPKGSEVEKALFYGLFGRKPMYVPAFRNVLQKLKAIFTTVGT